MTSISGRALHYVFKVVDRKLTSKFYREVLGMKVLRHEEFTEGCEASCNGPYANRWSKTMIGYGPEDTHFVLELAYNYGVKSYDKGNDYKFITIRSKEVLERAKVHDWPVLSGNILEAPGGYQFKIINEPQPSDTDPVEKVTLSSSNLSKSITYWEDILGLTIFEKSSKSVILGFNEKETKLELEDIGSPVNRGTAFGRIAFSCPHDQQPILDKKISDHHQIVIHPLTKLDTPGKASVRVLILADPDGHEICFVDDEGFRQLSQFDPEGDAMLTKYISLDKSIN